ncbi:MAG: GAF domain-containing protein [Deltaproteobacteria bacterium]|jgi:PAS domain S-box-containing protein|nr:GAF domain-containing protein [Deltaproteobacteria bacterium]
MTAKTTYSELQKKIKSLEQEIAGHQSIEKLLWQKQDQLFKVLDSLDAVVYVADLQSYEVLFANRYAEKLFGHITGKICWQVLQSGMTGPCSFCKNNELLTPEGRPAGTVLWEVQNTSNNRWYSIRDRAIEWFDGRVVHLQIAVDITYRKETEAALRESETKFRTVADFTYDWEYWINEEGKFNYISPSCERITGYRIDEFEENPSLLLDIMHPNDRQGFVKHLEDDLKSSEVCHLDFRIITRTGEERWISHSCQPVFGQDNVFLGRRASNRNITIQKKAEEQIRLNEIRHTLFIRLYEMQELPVREVCEFALESSLPLTESEIGFMGFLNDDESELSVLSWSRSVMRQCKIHDKPLVFDIAGSGLWGEAVRKRSPVIVNDYSVSPLKKGVPEGHVHIERFMAIPVFDREKIVAVAAVGNKRTNYGKEDVRQLQLLIEGMWQIVKRRQAEEDLLKQAAMIKQFTNSVSHDLKNPALAIHGLAGIIRKKHPNLPEEKLETFLTQILRNAEQIVNLADDINVYISTRETPLNPENLDLKETWQTVRKEFLPRFGKMGIAWSETERNIPKIRADRNGLLRVYRNLVDNALKYGGGGMTEIRLGYGTSPTHHILSVQNDGELIGPEDVDSIFEMFKRRTGHATPAGTGLGLAIVKEIAGHHRGSSWVESGPEGKTTFYITIARNL